MRLGNKGSLMIAISAVSLTSPPAQAADAGEAKPKYGFFFNRPGATAASLTSDLGACTGIAKDSPGNFTPVGVTNVAGILAGGILGSVLGSALAAGPKQRRNIENCMVIRGWRVYALTKVQGAAWDKLDETARSEKTAAMAGQESPPIGALYRVWQNDYAQPRLWPKKG